MVDRCAGCFFEIGQQVDTTMTGMVRHLCSHESIVLAVHDQSLAGQLPPRVRHQSDGIRPIILLLPTQHAVKRIAGLVNQCFGIIQVRMEVLEREITTVGDRIKCFEDRRPIRGPIEEWAKRFERNVCPLFREFLQMNVANSLP